MLADVSVQVTIIAKTATEYQALLARFAANNAFPSKKTNAAKRQIVVTVDQAQANVGD